MPENNMNAIAINPVIINVIPKPLNPFGTLLYFILSLIPARPTIAIAQPIPEPTSLIVWFLLGLTVAGGTWWKRRRS